MKGSDILETVAIDDQLRNELKEAILTLVRISVKPEIKPMAVYTYEEAAMLLSLSYFTIRRAVEAGYLKADYVGSDPRLRGRAIFEWLREGGKTGRSKRHLIEEQKRGARKQRTSAGR
jgi:excisionase family DNA binding protein